MTPSKAFGEGESGIDTLLSNRVNSVIIFCRLRPKDESIEKKIGKMPTIKRGLKIFRLLQPFLRTFLSDPSPIIDNPSNSLTH